MIWIEASGPYPSEDNEPNASIITPRIHTDLCLLHFNSSWKVETAHSVRAIELVSAANSTNTNKCTKSHTIKYFRNSNEHQ